MSNVLAVGAKRSATGHPLYVAGPQVGYFYPEYFLEIDLHGGGFDVRGAMFPGIPLVVIGRGRDFAWSATSSGADIVDQYVETLCGGDRLHYLYKGDCRAMGTFDAGTRRQRVGQAGARLPHDRPRPGRRLRDLERAAGRDLDEALLARPRAALRARLLPARHERRLVAAGVRADDGRRRVLVQLDVRRQQAHRVLLERAPAEAAGERRPRPAGARHGRRGVAGLRAVRRPPARRRPEERADRELEQQARAGLLAPRTTSGRTARSSACSCSRAGSRHGRGTRLASVVGAMNRAATQDLRTVEVWPVIQQVLDDGTAPSERDALVAKAVSAWYAHGSSRLDRDLDGRIDDPGAAVMDAFWPRAARAVLSPVLGPLTEQLAELNPVDDSANSQGSSYDNGWYGYVDKDLRSLLGQPVKAPFSERYCGGGSLAACSASLWAAMDAAGNELAAAQGPDPAAWRADANPERISFEPGLIPLTMRWTNRPTFQQVITFTGHRPR